MQLLPVLDLRKGRVVHACGGQRQDYQPLKSCLTVDAGDPHQLAQALQRHLGCTRFYVADLDALEGSTDQRDIVVSLIRSGYKLWLDAGVQSVDQVQIWLSLGMERIILASETIPSLHCLNEIVRHVEQQSLIVSLDFFGGKFRSPLAINEHEFFEHCCSLNLFQYILLDTAHVGQEHGPQIQRCLDLRQKYPTMTLITGGGVRDAADLDMLAQAGADIALVATALHRGRLILSDWQKYPFV